MAKPFTPEQISQILEEFFKVVGTRQYIGARYVPIFGRKDEDSIEWDNSAPYEPLTIVLYQGNSYTSRQYVPVGVEITNQEFWALTGNYNAQVEMYRQEVRNLLPYDKTPTEDSTKAVTSDGIEKAIAAENTRATNAEQTNATAIANEVTRAKEAEQTNATAIANEVTRATNAEKTNTTAIANEVTRATNAEKTNATAIANEVTRATNAEKTNAAAIANEVTRAKGAEKVNADAIAKLNGDFTTKFNKLSGDFTTNFNKLNGDITKLQNTKQNRKFSKMLYIGDSWGQGWTGSNHPSSGLAAYLGTALGCETINKSVSASGYIPNGDSKNYIGQLNSVTEEEKNGVDLVVVQGGINDGGSSFKYDNIVSAAVTLYNTIIQSYPDAKIVVINTPLPYGRNFGTSNINNATDIPQDMKPYVAIDKAVRNCSNPRQIQLIQSSYRWAQSFNKSDSYDGAHVNANGYRKFANIAAMCITNDTEFWPSYSQKISLNSAFGDVRCAYAYEVNGVCGICINAQIADNKTLANTDTICTLDQRFSRPRSMFGVGHNTANIGFYSFDNIYDSNGVCDNVTISQQGGNLTGGTWVFINLSWQAGC